MEPNVHSPVDPDAPPVPPDVQRCDVDALEPHESRTPVTARRCTDIWLDHVQMSEENFAAEFVKRRDKYERVFKRVDFLISWPK
jgi:signal transduction histidine kinase